ncbi:MBL fold metallo-hydrolase [uncultured Oscillibacter sp.]|uniref:MBL fold metallo-hydrolase n=1 Tax=uncultured Oscillibacter sp. TaxID=876091 RepID=UPI0028045A97|nr:MBL fold metallo-hydrolase [uncultured Oscillibacter sp.]
MRVTFLAHSGFFVELPEACLLFDWWKGTLPPIPQDRPLLVFASHRHEDHFSPAIFSLDDGTRDVTFLLGRDIRLTDRNRTRWNVSDTAAEHCIRLGGGEVRDLPSGVKIETLTSTDEGVAFLVTVGGRTLFHAGDLNWWHWEGEDPGWNRNMEVNFKAYTQPLQDRHLDLAMLPLDPRLGKDGFRGPRYFLDLARIRCMIPMHQWEDFGFTGQFLDAYPQYRSRVLPVAENGQVFSLDI